MVHAATPLESGPQRVHFAADQAEGSHRRSEEFRRPTLSPGERALSHEMQEGENRYKQTMKLQRKLHTDVPFEVWFKDWKLHERDIREETNLWKARFSAFVPLIKGLAFTIVELVKTLYYKVIGTKRCNFCENTLSRQWNGVKFSMDAIYSPNGARAHFIVQTLDPNTKKA